MIDWIIYYTDGSEWTSEDGSWEAAPYLGVQAIGWNTDPKDPADVGHRIEWKRDFYAWLPGVPQPWSVDLAGVYDYLIMKGSPLAHKPLTEMTLAQLGAEGVKMGRSVSDKDWAKIRDRILADTRLRTKSAWHPDELPEPDHY